VARWDYPWSLRDRSLATQWAAMLVASAVFVALLEWLRLPAALMLGPMIGGILVSVANAQVRVAPRLFGCGQAVVGCLMASSITPGIIATARADWALFGGAIVAVVVVSSGLGWFMTARRMLPGTTGIWGSSAGAATAMVLMSETNGADMRLVAFMQYLRLVMVAVVASVVASLTGSGGPGPGAIQWFPALGGASFAATMALAATAAALGPYLPLPAASLLTAFGAGAALNLAGVMTITLPPWLLAGSYALVGWTIGLRFSRPVLAHVWRLLPRIFLSTAALIGVCGGLGMVLARLAGIDQLTAYMAMSPGGADSIAIIAASSRVDLSFVMALQSSRLVLVMVVGPALARILSRRYAPPP
jgi:uncharacterized protein